MSTELIDAGGDPFRVVIAGGGVAAIEAMLALRALAAERIEIEMLAPDREFFYRPLAIAEIFGLGESGRFDLGSMTTENGARLRLDSLAAVDPESRLVRTASGEELDYDALLIAFGARPVEALPGALTYGGPAVTAGLVALLSDLESGRVRSVAFAVPAGTRWTLALYELALMTAAHLQRHRVEGASLVLVTGEAEPLGLFGHRVGVEVAAELREAGVEVRLSVDPAAVDEGGLKLADGSRVEADRVVALPRLEVPDIPGIPQGPDGFIGTDPFMQVEGLTRVYAAGDATWFPIKQGGLAAQQADVAAASIAACAGAAVERKPFRPVLRAALLTGSATRYLRSEVGDRDGASAVGVAPLWWPPSKIAARYLAPYLARGFGDEQAPPLDDVEGAVEDDERARRIEEDYRDSVELALSAADADARWNDFRSALRWLAVAEQLALTLPPDYADKRRRWQAALTGASPKEFEPPVGR